MILITKTSDLYVCMYVCMYVCIMYVCMYVCMFVCRTVYVCMYVCMYVFIKLHITAQSGPVIYSFYATACYPPGGYLS